MDNSLLDSKTNGIVQDDVVGLEKLTQSYLLLKHKLCRTHEVIKQYNDKLKECERLKTDLNAATKQTKNVTCNYNSTLAKVIKLELQNTEYKKKIDASTTEVNEHKLKVAADQQYIQQLICKIKDVEDQQNDKILQYDLEKASLQVRVKELEQELKNVKKSYDAKVKKLEKKISTENSSNINISNSISNKVTIKDVGINTTPIKETIPQKPIVAEKCVMTDEFYNVKDNLYPVFCAKCEVALKPPPLDKICQIMTNSCPQLIEQISSPPIKVPSPLRASSDTNSEQCKSENSTGLETPAPPPTPLHLQNQHNHVEVISANFLPSRTPIALNHTDYCDNFPQPSRLMNESAYYIGSTPVNPLTSASTANQSNRCEDMGAVASSLSIVSSLQKRIDVLETKVKKKLSKAKAEKASNCRQHARPSACCMYDINSSMQLNMMEMWKRMTDIYDNKKKEDVDAKKQKGKHANKSKLPRLKPMKRLQSRYSGPWRVEPLAKKREQSPTKKKPKKRKYRHSMLLNKSDDLLNDSDDLEKLVSDSDTNMSDELFKDAVVNTDVSIESKKAMRTEVPSSHTKASGSKIPTHPTLFADTDEAEVVEATRNSAESVKSVGCETDSGILSDSVESSKLVQLETDIDTCSGPVERRNVAKVKSSTQNVSSFVETKLTSSQCLKKSPIKVVKSSKLVKARLSSEVFDSDEHTEKMKDNEIETSRFNGSVLRATTSTSYGTTSPRKRKFSEHQEQKKVSHRQHLLKKLRNLKKSSRIVKPRQNVSDHQELQTCELESSCLSQEGNHSASKTDATKRNDYIPKKKKPRIAHVPKSTIVKEKSLLKGLRVRKCLAKTASARIKRPSAAVNIIESNANTVAEQTSVTQRNTQDPSETPVVREVAKEDSSKVSQKVCGSRLEQLKLNRLNAVNPETADVTNDNNAEEAPIIDVKQLSRKCSASYSRTFIKSTVGNSLQEILELNEMKTESNDQCDRLKQECENNSTDSIEATTEGEKDESKNSVNEQLDELWVPSSVLNTGESEANKRLSISETYSFEEGSCNRVDLQSSKSNYPKDTADAKSDYVRSEDVEDIVKNEEPCDLSDLVLKSGDMDLIDIHEHDLKKEACSDLKEETFLDLKEETFLDLKEETFLDLKEETFLDLKEETFLDLKEETDKSASTEEINSTVECKAEPHSLLAKLQQYISETKCPSKNCKSQFKKLLYVRLVTDKFLKTQLQRLADDEWQSSVHWDVIEKLKSSCSPRIIAKGIVDFLSTDQECNILDKSHTPPAPLMTKPQQRIAALLVDLKDPATFQLVQSGIEYKLFRLNQMIQKSVLESLARMYVVLARIKKDREKVRIFCCDALYSLGLNAIIVLYTVFTCWPEVFPNNETNNELLPKCMAYVIGAQQATDFSKLNALKNLVSIFYKYPTGTLPNDLMETLLTALQEKCHSEIETAIILLAKKEGTTWTYKNVIRGALLPMIINNKLPSTYRAFCLLGNLMRAFPIEDKDNSVGEIVEQLCDLINSGEGSDEQQEGVISALLSLSRHKFDEVVQSVIKWSPNGPLHYRTTQQFNGLFQMRTPEFWRGYIKKHKLLPQIPKQFKV